MAKKSFKLPLSVGYISVPVLYKGRGMGILTQSKQQIKFKKGKIQLI